ncbi:lactate racemase domain-containing protein [Maribellus maritimus]|uniref:lactate racemase domain-containing protein n=1 Tax=Maribellus maritimus TaxID=2870838 RepID=UPI001EEC0C2B|nr:lactate racemase domain-containing protein [Maribellus maritimus]MCG6190280.1 lactate racemase domain-containing protein [Maribellus maritimus]
MAWFFERKDEIPPEQLELLVKKSAQECLARINSSPKKILLLPPDITRRHSGAGKITNLLYHFFASSADVYVMPTLGQHLPHTPEQNRWMFGDIPEKKIIKHDWIKDGKHLGFISAAYVEKITDGKANWEIPVNINRLIIEEKWDIILNIGHVVPHEVLGFANHNKNYFIGLGGKEMICASHMAAACYGIENNLGNLVTPLRHCFNKAESEYFSELPDAYIQVVMKYNQQGKLVHSGFYCGDDVDTYLMAAEQSKAENITIVPPLKKVVAVMQGDEFFSTWVANKAIYRTRKAMADGGELIIIAPGLKRFGEQDEVDQIIRKYGYSGTPAVMKAWNENYELQDLTHATAHLIHGSSEGRFKITYAPGHLSKDEIESVNFNYLHYQKAMELYDPAKMKDGFNTLPNGEEIYFISTPSAGLWTTKDKLNDKN